MCERQKLLKQIRMHYFAVTDVVLYLDSHPTCENALAYYAKQRKMLEEAVACYNAQYGPLTMLEEDCSENRWTWTEGPWPWELEA